MTWSNSTKSEPARTIAPLMASLRPAHAPVVPLAVLAPSTLKPRIVMWSLCCRKKAAEKLLAPLVRSWSVLPVPIRVRPLRPVRFRPASPPSR